MRVLTVILLVAVGCSLVTCRHRGIRGKHIKHVLQNIVGSEGDDRVADDNGGVNEDNYDVIEDNDDVSEDNDDVSEDNDGASEENENDEYDDIDSTTTEIISLADAPKKIANTVETFVTDIGQVGTGFVNGFKNLSNPKQSHDVGEVVADRTVSIATGVIDGVIKTADHVIDDANQLTGSAVESTKYGLVSTVKLAAGDSFKGNVEEGVNDIAVGLADGTRTFVSRTLHIIHDVGETIGETVKAGKPIVRGVYKLLNGTLESVKPEAMDAAVFIETSSAILEEPLNNALDDVKNETMNVVEGVEVGAFLLNEAVNDVTKDAKNDVVKTVGGIDSFLKLLFGLY